ncbi:MAG: tetratricopeptide repeat protein [Gemmatimonadaceae bacterium]
MTMRDQARQAKFFLLAAVVASATGCFASIGQMDDLREEVNVVRTDNAAADSVRVTQIVQILGSLRAINDSLAAFGTRLSRVRAESQSEIRALRQDILQVQEISGQSQRRLQEMRATLEQRNRQPQAQSSPLPTAETSTPVVVPPVEDAPGPNELFQLGRDQQSRGGNRAARAAFSDLLRRFPESDIADDAQFYLAEAYAAEGNAAAADSAYALVGAKYSSSIRAPTALYKRAVMAQTARRTTSARRLFNEVIRSYPQSDEADLARERLRLLS